MKLTADGATALSFLVVLAGSILWLSTMYADLTHATAAVKSLAGYQKDIDKRLSRIEGKLDILITRGDP